VSLAALAACNSLFEEIAGLDVALVGLDGHQCEQAADIESWPIEAGIECDGAAMPHGGIADQRSEIGQRGIASSQSARADVVMTSWP